MVETLTGLILSRQWLDQDGGQALIYWISSQGLPARIEISPQESVFFISEKYLTRMQMILKGHLEWRHAPLKLNCFSENQDPAVACYFRNQKDLGFARAQLQKNHIKAFESDIRPTDRYLMERFIRGVVEVTGECIQRPGYLDFKNPQLRPSAHKTQTAGLVGLSVVSLDIETSVTRGVILSIAIHTDSVDQVFMVGESRPTTLSYLCYQPDERSLLVEFIHCFSDLDPDVIIGWSVVGFDLKYIQDRCDAHKIDFAIGRAGSRLSWRTVERGQTRHYVVVPGRVVLDGIELLRTATYSFESFSLENVSRELLNRGKLVHDVDSRALEIEVMHQQDQDSLARYNLEDCVLVSEIFKKTNLIAFAIERSCLTGLELDRQGGSVAAFDFLYLPRLHRAGFIAPVVDEDVNQGSPGGYVFDSIPGIYHDVVVLDFKSLYPSIIRTFYVDPLAMLDESGQQVPGFLGAFFSADSAILPQIIKELWQARDHAKAESNSAVSQAIKIIMNSFYGVLGTLGCRFFDPKLVSSITLRGHEILQKTRDLIEDKGFKVIYGDTDSVFVHMQSVSGRVPEHAEDLVVSLNNWWCEELNLSYKIKSHLEIEYETHFEKFFMPTIRGSEKGSKKRYAGVITVPGVGPKIIFKGLESVRSDWSPLAREFQQELYRRVFAGESVEGYVIDLVLALRRRQLDDKLVLRRRLRRKLDDYVKNVPPHVRAARAAERVRKEKGLTPAYEWGGWIEYVMTVVGPEPVAYSDSEPDYDFYVERQLAPIADAILSFQGTSLAKITDKQLGLF